MSDSLLLSHDQFSLLGIVIAIAAYTVVVHQVLNQKIGRLAKQRTSHRATTTRPKTLRLTFLNHTQEFLIVADVMLVLAGSLLVVRMLLWAKGQAGRVLLDWLDLDRLILAQAGVAFLFLAGLHVRGLIYRMGWMYPMKRDQPGPSDPKDDMSSETVRRVAEKLEQHNSS